MCGGRDRRSEGGKGKGRKKKKNPIDVLKAEKRNWQKKVVNERMIAGEWDRKGNKIKRMGQ